jgi:hypothetical protein
MNFTTREDLTDVAARHAPTNACATAMRQQRAVVLGGFATPGTLPCWIVRVDSKRGKQWFIAVDCDEANVKYGVRYLESDEVPWEDWIGKSTGRRILIDGDEPVLSAYKRCQAVRRIRALT